MTLRTKVHLVLIPSLIAIIAAFIFVPYALLFTAGAVFFAVIGYSVYAIYVAVSEAIINHIKYRQ